MDERGELFHFVGYTNTFNTYRLYDPRKEEVIIHCDLKFITEQDDHINDQNDDTIEIDIIRESKPHQNETDDSQRNSQSDDDQNSEVDPISDISSIEGELNESYHSVIEQEEMERTPKKKSIEPNKVDSTNKNKPTKEKNVSKIPRELQIQKKDPVILEDRLRTNRQTDFSQFFPERANLSTIEKEQDPKNFNDAMSRDDKQDWLEAMSDELDSLKKNKVFELVERPKGHIITSRWVYVTKRDPNGEKIRNKARLVARGFTQIYGLDYFETYAPVVNNTFIRMLFQIAVRWKLTIGQFDVKTAFLYGDLEEEIYMEQPEGFKIADKVWRLKKSLYGLKQAPRQWNKRFDDALKQMGLKSSKYDNCVYYKFDPILIIAIYVDDGLVLAENQSTIDKTMDLLKREFEMTKTEVSTFLGFQIERRNKEEIMLYQEGYINKILNRFGMEEAKPADSPVMVKQETSESKSLDPEIPYREAVGSLMYAGVNTRIDISYAVGRVSRKLADPNEQDWIDVKRIFRYLKGKERLGIRYIGKEKEGLKAFCDADFAGDLTTSKSTTGFVVLLGGTPITWKSKRQTTVTRSSTEAELEALCTTVDEVVWIRNMCLELRVIDNKPVPVYCDNQSTVRIVQDERSIHRTRHLKTKAAYIRERMDDKEVEIHHVKAEYQKADMLTKPLTGPSFIRNRNWLMSLVSILLLVMLLEGGDSVLFER